MKAIILDSGIGNRMGEFTQTHHKSMAVLKNGETIFERQLRVLCECGIQDFIITTGPFEDQLRQKAAQPQFQECRFTWVPNPVYSKTNYIYSLYLAHDQIDSDCLLLHGDLVFGHAHVIRLLEDQRPNLGSVQPHLPLPEKDFKAKITDNRIAKISVKVFGEDCVSFQPLYKLSRAFVRNWMERIASFVENGETGVYAEEALNELLEEGLSLEPFDCGKDFIGEVDNMEDLEMAGKEIRLVDFRHQEIINGPDGISTVPEFLKKHKMKKTLLVAGQSLDRQPFGEQLLSAPTAFIRFSEFTANPDKEEVMAAVKLYRDTGCEGVIASGGGSALDIGKCVKLLAAQPEGTDFVKGPYACTHIPMLAIPTTAGTGSESTHFSVMYVDGMKCSVQHDSMLPETVILLPEALLTLPDYQKRCTFLDAVCHGIESIWSVRATEESKEYAEQGLRLLINNFNGYLRGEEGKSASVMLGANYCGRAINLSQTTAAHAMSYVVTKRFQLPHGHAVAACMNVLLPFMLQKYRQNPEEYKLSAGFSDSLLQLMRIFNVNTEEDLCRSICSFLHVVPMTLPNVKECKAEELAQSVNEQRLANHPMCLTEQELTNLYSEMFEG